MSGAFTGFSEDYIQELNSGTSTNKDSQDKHKGSNENSNPSLKNRETTDITKKIAKEEQRGILLFQKLDKFKFDPIPVEAKLDIHSEASISSEVTTASVEDSEEAPISSDIEKIGETPTPSSSRRFNLEVIQARQKLIEEQNRKRKEILSKALADKTQKTLSEAQKLKEIQTELQKLDSINYTDICILRKQIELASIDYMETEKRYYKVEREFLNSKLNLQLKLERKELLAEHLCAIIEKNEEKKAQKLDEMLSQLNLSTENIKDNNSDL